MNTETTLVVVDVSKSTLEVKSDNQSFSIHNSKAGISRMLRSLGNPANLFVVCEATGG